MASERFRGPIQRVLAAAPVMGGRFQDNAVFLADELVRDDRALAQWLSSPFGVAVFAEMAGALHQALEAQPRHSLIVAACRVLDDIEAMCRAERRQAAQERHATMLPPAAPHPVVRLVPRETMVEANGQPIAFQPAKCRGGDTIPAPSAEGAA
jgi:hypothetical protein